MAEPSKKRVENTRKLADPEGAPPATPSSNECQILRASELDGLTPQKLAATLNRPSIIRGLVDSWEAHERFPDAAAFGAAFGNHSVLARRVNFARERAHAAGVDPSTAQTTVGEMIERLRYEHIVLYHGEGSMARSEYELLV